MTIRRRGLGVRKILIACLVATLVVGALVAPAASTPVATDETQYTAYGRVFPDPQGCEAGQPGASPYAKGRVCAADFIQFDEMIQGMQLLNQLFPRFVEVYRLDRDFDCKGRPVSNPDAGCKDFRSAGLPQTLPEGQDLGFSRARLPLYMYRITDESVPDTKKKHFVYSVGLHGPERAGVEGGFRAAEDLATWGACEAKIAPESTDCAAEGEAPYPILEATPKQSLTAGNVLRRSSIYFVAMNPDGWQRGDRDGASFYQRFNGNGVDLNRDWPEEGFTYRPYTPWSEPESRAYGRVLQSIGPKDSKGRPKWTGGIDLHGQLNAPAFSFTLIGGAQRPYSKNQRVLQTVKGAWRDAEKRLAWSTALIKPNDAPQEDPRMYGVQWGTVWDTIDYTVTGAFGNWIDSPIGLNADGLDNEMSLSHIGNCGTGSCFERQVEQLHVDGNKSLIYSMINFSLKKENQNFRVKGPVGYVFNRGAVSERANRLSSPPRFAKLPTQPDIPKFQLAADNQWTREFKVKGPGDGVYNGGLGVTLTCPSAVSNCSLTSAVLERKIPAGEESAGEWETVNSYYNQSPIYAQGGQALHANLPVAGLWRVRIMDTAPTDVFTGEVDFQKEKAWPDPGQVGYRATNMNFWKMMRKYVKPGLTKLTPRTIATTNGWMRRYDTVVVTNKVYAKLAPKLRKWVARFNGNLVLTDAALKMLPKMRVTPKGIGVVKTYAGYVNFQTAKKDSTYADPLAKGINQPGAAEGRAGGEVRRRQTYEPVPLGFAIQTPDDRDAFNSPVWYVKGAAWKKAKGRERAVATTGERTNISYGEIKYRGGRIRLIGALLPMPTKKFDNPFGLADYGLTYSGYQMLKNSLTWKN